MDTAQDFRPIPTELSKQSDTPQLLAQPRKLKLGAGVDWIAQSWRLFARRKWTWMGMVIVMTLITMLIQLIPLIGLISSLLSFFFIGGLMLSCDALAEGDELKFSFLFSGFQYKFKPLLILTLLYLGIIVLLGAISFAVFGLSGLFSENALQTFQPSASLLLPFAFIWLAFMAVMMALWLAPALVVLDDVSPWQAMKMSFQAVWRNIPAFLVNGLVWLMIMMVVVFAALFLGLAISGFSLDIGNISTLTAILWFLAMCLLMAVITPLMMINAYISYRSIWTTPQLEI